MTNSRRHPLEDADRPPASGIGDPVPRWVARLDDPAEPLYTMAVVCELLGTDPQAIRRLDRLDLTEPTRSKGNHRRYSRNDIGTLAAALELIGNGVPPLAVPRVLATDARVRQLESRLDSTNL